MSRMTFPTQRRHTARRIIFATVGVSLVACFVLWLMLHYKPHWYQPAVGDDATIHRAQVSAADLLDLVSDRLAAGDPFEITIEDHVVNDWLAALPRLWPKAEEVIPSAVQNLAARFDSDRLCLGAHWGDGELQSIVSADLAIALSPDGSNLIITVVAAHAGAIPLPHNAIREIMGRYESGASNAGSARADDGSTNPEPRDMDFVEQLLSGMKIPNEFVWSNGKRRFKIASLTMSGGELRMGIDPL